MVCAAIRQQARLLSLGCHLRLLRRCRAMLFAAAVAVQLDDERRRLLLSLLLVARERPAERSSDMLTGGYHSGSCCPQAAHSKVAHLWACSAASRSAG